MPTPLSVDLRQRVVAFVLGGASCREAATRFGVSAASACRWAGRMRQDGHVAPTPSGGDQMPHRVEAQAELIRATYKSQPTIFLRELRDQVARYGLRTSTSGLSRFCTRSGPWVSTEQEVRLGQEVQQTLVCNAFGEFPVC